MHDTLQDLVKELQQKLGKTFIFVTHDMDEAIKLADKICIMSKGKVVQYDTPDNIFTISSKMTLLEILLGKIV